MNDATSWVEVFWRKRKEWCDISSRGASTKTNENKMNEVTSRVRLLRQKNEMNVWHLNRGASLKMKMITSQTRDALEVQILIWMKTQCWRLTTQTNNAQYQQWRKRITSNRDDPKEYRTMLLGRNLEIYNDQKNFNFRTLLWTVLRYRLYMEQPWITKSRLGRKN